RAAQLGDLLPVQRVTVADFLAHWLQAIQPSIRPKTLASYEGVVRLHLIPMVGGIQLQKLTPAHVGGAISTALRSGMSPTLARYCLLVLRNALAKAQRWELVHRNVARLVDPPRVERARHRALAADEAVQLLQAAAGDPLEALYTVALALGLRLGEALG